MLKKWVQIHFYSYGVTLFFLLDLSTTVRHSFTENIIHRFFPVNQNLQLHLVQAQWLIRVGRYPGFLTLSLPRSESLFS